MSEAEENCAHLYQGWPAWREWNLYLPLRHNPVNTLLSELLTISRAYAIQIWMMPANMAQL